MRKGLLTILIIFVVLSFQRVFAKNLSWEKIQDIDKGRKVYPVSILKNSAILLLSESRAGGGYKLIWLSSKWKTKKRLSIPLAQMDYIASDFTGRNIVVYSKKRFSFLHLDSARGFWNIFSSRQGAQIGFALYSGKKSHLIFTEKSLFALGYFYDRTGDYIGEWIVRLFPKKKGKKSIQKIISTSTIDKRIIDIFPKTKKINFLAINDKYIIIKAIGQYKNYLIGYNIKKDKYFFIDCFLKINGCTLSKRNDKLIYIIKPLGSTFSGVLFVYDLKKKKTIKCIPGQFFMPVFNTKGNIAAVGKFFKISGHTKVPEILIFSIKNNKTERFTLPGNESLYDWQFSGKNYLTIFTNRRIFKRKFSLK